MTTVQNCRETLTEQHNRFAADLGGLIGRHDMVWGEPDGPSADWRRGAPIGNGDFGAIISGYPDNLTFALAKTDLWVRLADESNFPSGTFADVRDIYASGDEARFEELRKTPSPTPYSRTSHVTTAGFLRLRIADGSIHCACSQRVSLFDALHSLEFRPTRLNADTTVAYEEPFAVSAFCSRSDDVMVLRIDPAGHPLSTVTLELGRQTHPCLQPARPEIRGRDYLVHQELLKGDRYVVAMRACGQSCSVQLNPRAVCAEIAGESAEPVTAYLTIVSGRDSDDPAAEALARLERAEAKGYDALFADHAAWWRDFWRRSYVSIEDRKAERWWYVSNYLAGSMLRPGKGSPGRQGVGVKENIPAWAGDYHGNINIQADYWGLLAGNRLDLMEPYFRLYTEMLPQCRKDTRRYFQMRGARLPHAADVDGHELTDNRWFVLAVHHSITGWITQPFWQYYEYTGDVDFLRDVAYPVISDAATFYADYLQWDEAANCYFVEPSISFESNCPTFQAYGRNSTYDLAIFRMTFQIAIKAAEILGDAGPLPDEWRGRLQKLAPYPRTPEGGWAAWEGRGPIVDGHGVALPFLPPIFPCGLVSAFHGSPEDRAAAELSWEVMRVTQVGKGACGASALSWCGGSPIATAAAMGQADAALAGARWADGDQESGLLSQWRSYYMQADHGPGMALALNSMFLGSYGGTIHVFPATPAQLDARFHSLRAPGAFLVSAEQRGGAVAYAVIQSLRGGAIRVASPFNSEAQAGDSSSRTVVRARELESGRTVFRRDLAHLEVATWETAAGKTYVLEDEAQPLEEWPHLEIG